MGVTNKLSLCSVAAVVFLAGCGNENVPQGSLKSSSSNSNVTSTSVAATFYADSLLKTLETACFSCHTPGGDAADREDAELIFSRTDAEASFQMLSNFILDDGQINSLYKENPTQHEFYAYPNGEHDHPGGRLLNSEALQHDFSYFIQLIHNAAPVISSATPSVSTGEAPLAVSFNVSFADEDSPAAEMVVQWSIFNKADDSELVSEIGTNLQYTFSNSGTYYAVVTVEDELGARTSLASQDIVVAEATIPNELPTAGINVSESVGLVPFVVNVDGSSSSDPDGQIAKFQWNFGDGSDASNATGANWQHTYETSGRFNIRLTVTDDIGATASQVVSVTATEKPIANFSSQTVSDAALTFAFDASTSADNGADDDDIASYSWDFGDGSISQTGPVVQHQYAEAGTYTVALTVTDTHGYDSDSATQTVTAQTCVATEDFFASNVYPELTTCFACHVAGGVATLTQPAARIIFDATDAQASYLATEAFVTTISDGAALLIDKPAQQNGQTHTGGKVLSSGDSLYQAFESLVTRIQDPNGCYQ